MPTINDQRITARVPCTVKNTLEQAAAMLGTPLNQFMVQASLRAAQEVIRQEQSVKLSRHDVSAMFDYLNDVPPANDALTNAAHQHQTMTRS